MTNEYRVSFRPPDDVLGEAAAIAFILARSDRATIKVQHFTAYASGFEFELAVHHIVVEPPWDPMYGLAGRRDKKGESRRSDDALRFGVQFSDGFTTNNMAVPVAAGVRQQERSRVLRAFSGRADESPTEPGRWSMRASFWIDPLPPPGQIIFSCEWPANDIPRTAHEIDAHIILDAAQRSASECE